MSEPKIVNGCNQAITAYLARTAVIGTGRKPTMVLMHPAQMHMICNLIETMTVENTSAEVEDAFKKVKDLLEKFPPVTFMGLPIHEVPEMPDSWIEFHDTAGVISRIVSLAVPLGARSDEAISEK
jgi:hypothetical protein